MVHLRLLLAVIHLTSIQAQDACVGDTCENVEQTADSALLQTKRAARVQSDAESESEEGVALEALDPVEAVKRHGERKALVVESDLRALLRKPEHAPHRGRGASKADVIDPQDCLARADALFDDVVKESGLAAELAERELIAYKQRFNKAVASGCKGASDEQQWLNLVGAALEQQKPLMTEALAASLNEASLGHRTAMSDWLVHESVASFDGRLGLLPTPEGQKSIFKRKAHGGRTAINLPESFQAQQKWPECRGQIIRVHNQGHCGSCWAFAGLSAIDARMCIASRGAWNTTTDTLSRLHLASCAPAMRGEKDGCEGGLPTWPLDYLAKEGVVSASCVPYYIGGEGKEHFQQKHEAPPCETHCQEGYSLALREDKYQLQGVNQYDWVQAVHGDAAKMLKMKEAIYSDGPISFAFKANPFFMGYIGGVFSHCNERDRSNHAVYAYGWGVTPTSWLHPVAVEYMWCSNSWGRGWGLNGHFKLHPRCVVDYIIPGTIEGAVVDHPVGQVDEAVPPDSENEFWPWRKPAECPFVDGCVTDMEGDGHYKGDEYCVSNKLNGKLISFEEFDTEATYDKVTINGYDYSGKGIHGMDYLRTKTLTVDDNGITFKADASVGAKGFKICARDHLWER